MSRDRGRQNELAGNANDRGRAHGERVPLSSATNHIITRISIQTAGLAFGGTAVCVLIVLEVLVAVVQSI